MYPPVSPILVNIGPFTVRWYGVIMTTAIFLGTLIASRYVARKKQDPGTVWEMLFVVLVPALIGARLYFVFIQSGRVSFYLSNPGEILAIWHGGIHIYGALILGSIALLLFIRLRKLPALIYLDGIGLGLLLGQAIGRLGNFINQELYGPPTTLPWGLRIDPQYRIAPYNNLLLYPTSVRFHPLFLYELTWDLIGFALLFYLSRRLSKSLRDGDLFLLYLIWFPFGRFWIEFLRSDSSFFPGTHFDLVHIVSALTILICATLLILRHRAKPTVQAPSDAEATDSEQSPVNGEHENTTGENEHISDSLSSGSLGIEG
jgi:phosphatidylglycerol---prolipoprotein diacylglyceryl transferase